MKRIFLTSVAALALTTSMALAADVSTKKKADAPPPPPPMWWDAVTITGHVEGGTTINFANPWNQLNFGRLFDDRASTPTLNQALLTIQKPLDPKATGYDWGFKVQGMIGSDARYTHFLGELDYAIHDRVQLDVVEAFAVAHLPWAFEGGIDVKVGQFVTLSGAEVIPAADNPFYSHSYIFNFGVPLKHTGVMTISHVAPWLDIYAGITSGVNTSLGWPGDNNSSPSFHGGIGLTFLDGALTALATTHIGPENPKQLDPLGVGWSNTPVACACNPNSALRYLNDITVTWKATDNLTFITDLNYIRDDGWNPDPWTGRARGVDGYGGAQYAIYKVNDWVKIAGRAEIWRDNNGFFVGAFPGYNDFLNVEHGFPAPSVIFAPGAGAFHGTTYFALTAGLTLTPEVPKNPYITGLIMRPELRWDTSLNNTTPFAGGTKRSTVTFGFDVIVPFTIK
jgi:hypothetical protein